MLRWNIWDTFFFRKKGAYFPTIYVYHEGNFIWFDPIQITNHHVSRRKGCNCELGDIWGGISSNSKKEFIKLVPLQDSSRWPFRYKWTDTGIEWPINWKAAPVAQDHNQTETQHRPSPPTSQDQYTPLTSVAPVQGYGKDYADHLQQPEILYYAHHPWRPQKRWSTKYHYESHTTGPNAQLYIKLRSLEHSRYDPGSLFFSRTAWSQAATTQQTNPQQTGWTAVSIAERNIRIRLPAAKKRREQNSRSNPSKVGFITNKRNQPKSGWISTPLQSSRARIPSRWRTLVEGGVEPYSAVRVGWWWRASLRQTGKPGE